MPPSKKSSQSRDRTATPPDDRLAGRGWQDLDGAHLCERRHETIQLLPAVGIHDQVESVGVVDHGLCLDGDALSGSAPSGQMSKQQRTHPWIACGASFCSVFVTRYEEGHLRFS